jgi:glyoxylase-like metal-dependent hydrolase (beta-lactamase superfamily II)
MTQVSSASGSMDQGVGRRFAVDAADWFEVVAVEPGLHLVSEPGHVFSWLIAGSERCVLLDTGLGIADISAAIEPVTALPVSVVNSHTHFDHVGGNRLFDSVAMHELGPRWLEANTDDSELEAYAPIAARLHEGFERLLAVDRESWFLVGPGERVREWPTEAITAAGGWHIDATEPQRLLADGDQVELGDRTLRVIHTPGHAPDHICLVDEAAGILFAQDQAYYGPHLIYLDGSDVAEFARSARRLADQLRGSVRAVFVAHCLRPSVPPGFLDELADAAEEVASGEATLRPAGDVIALEATMNMFGEEILGADYGHFSILVPRGAGT